MKFCIKKAKSLIMEMRENFYNQQVLLDIEIINWISMVILYDANGKWSFTADM